MTPTSSNVYGVAVGTTSTNPFVPILSQTDPTSADTKNSSGTYPIGKRWINTVANVTYTLASFSSLGSGIATANWVSDGGAGGGNLNTLSGDTGLATPTLGNIQIAGSGNISTAAAGSVVTISSSGGLITPITFITDEDSAYTVLPTDYFISAEAFGNPLTILLPDAPVTGRVIIIKDTDTSGGVAITVTTVSGTDLIDGQTTYVMTVPLQSISLIWDGSAYSIF